MMIPVGYMYKRVAPRQEWHAGATFEDIYSVSGCCCSKNFADYINYWKHNGYWLFDTPALMEEIAREVNIDLSGMTLFYYEAIPEELEADSMTWSAFQPEASFPLKVEIPSAARIEGYDVVTFSYGNSPECSPLSCNNLAAEIPVNRHCLFDSLEEAKEALEAGKFDLSEPGPFRVFAVYTVGG